jgi:hypothetical protein
VEAIAVPEHRSLEVLQRLIRRTVAILHDSADRCRRQAAMQRKVDAGAIVPLGRCLHVEDRSALCAGP